MSARSLLGRPVEPYIHDEGGDHETRIELKVPKFGTVLPVLRLHQKHTLATMRVLRGILREDAGDQADETPDDSIYRDCRTVGAGVPCRRA